MAYGARSGRATSTTAPSRSMMRSRQDSAALPLPSGWRRFFIATRNNASSSSSPTGNSAACGIAAGTTPPTCSSTSFEALAVVGSVKRVLGSRLLVPCHRAAQGGLHFAGADRLDEVLIEAGFAGAPLVFLHAVAGERDQARMRA